MKRHVEQPVRPALAENLALEIGEHGDLLTRRSLLNSPNQTSLMQNEELIGVPRDLTKRGEPRFRFGSWELESPAEERPDGYRLCEGRDDARHALLAHQRGLRLP